MKRITITVLIVCAFLITKVNAQIECGVKGGLNFNHLSYKAKDNNPDKKPMSMGFNLGLVVKYPIQDAIFLQSGLSYSMKGGEWKYNSGEKIKNSLNYLILPVNIGYTISDLDIFVGPYFGYCFGGKAKVSGNGASETLTYKPEKDKYTKTLGDKDRPVAPMDLGFNLGIAYNLKPVKVGLGYDMGFTNLHVNSKVASDAGAKRDDIKIKNGVVSLNVTYMFGQKD
jgi:hypothetical protein